MTNLPDDVDQRLIEITSQLLKESDSAKTVPVRMDASLQRHLGIDSLGRAELFQRIEKQFSVTLKDQLLIEAETLQEIANELRKAQPALVPRDRRDVVYSHGASLHLNPETAETLLDVLWLYGKQASKKTHIYFQHEEGKEEEITYGQLLEASLSVAAGLKKLGLSEGETVAIMQPTNPGFFYAFLGTLLAGGIPVPIYPPFRLHMLEVYARTEAIILNNAETRILITFAQAEQLSQLLKGFVPSLKHVTQVDALLASAPLPDPFVAKAEHFAFIQYTSGSTADPKGVLLTHRNLLANIRAYGEAIHIQPDDVAVSWLPLYHDMGLIGMWLGSLYYGVPLVLLTPFSFLNHPERWLWAIHYHRGTLSGAPNFAYELCIRKIDEARLEGLDLSSWRMAANGAEKIYPSTLKEFTQRFQHYGLRPTALLPVYGLAESTVALTISAVDDLFQIDYVDRQQFEEKRLAVQVSEQHKQSLAFVNCGKPIRGQSVRVVDDQGQVLGERQVGHIQFCGTSSMQGYYHHPRATADIFHEGWWETGDLGYQAAGHWYITGRRKDLIIKAGRNLYPAEIEVLVGQITGVRQGCVAVFGVTNQQRGTEELIIVAETREKAVSARNKIIASIQERVATVLDLVPDDIVLVQSHTVPKTSSGKLQRAACKHLYLNGKLNQSKVPPWMQMARLIAKGVMGKLVAGLRWMGKAVYTTYVALLIMLTILPIYFIVFFSSSATAIKVCRYWARFIFAAAACPVRVVGREKLTETKSVIYACNHASYLDAIVILMVAPQDVRVVAKKELFNIPVVRTFLKKVGCISVDRQDLLRGLEDAAYMASVLKTGVAVLIFPEGTFSYASGLRPFRLGAFKVAAETGTPVYPWALKGTRVILRDNEKLMRPGKIEVTICDPIHPAGIDWQATNQLCKSVRDQIALYCGEPSLEFIAAAIVGAKRPTLPPV